MANLRSERRPPPRSHRARRPAGRGDRGPHIPRLRTYAGFETPKPILVEVKRSDADLKTVMSDVLALMKVNYNAYDYASGLPVTLKFSDRVGETLTASRCGLRNLCVTAPMRSSSPPVAVGCLPIMLQSKV